MKNGFVRVAAATPDIRVGDVLYNSAKIRDLIRTAIEQQVKLVVFPEMTLSGYTVGDIVFQSAFQINCLKSLKSIVESTKGKDILAVIGFPFIHNGSCYSAAAVIQNGSILAVIPKSVISDSGVFSESRYFKPAPEDIKNVEILGQIVPFGSDIMLQCREMPSFKLSVEISGDLYSLYQPSQRHALAGATVIATPAALPHLAGKTEPRKDYIKVQSDRTVTAYIYSEAGPGESSTDLVFSGMKVIAEKGRILKESELYKDNIVITEIDVDRIENERLKNSVFSYDDDDHMIITFDLDHTDYDISRPVDPMPFVPSEPDMREQRCAEVLSIQKYGLIKRLKHTHIKNAVLGISGGIDSTLALIVTVLAFDELGISRKHISAVTMPCFGTSERTHDNAVDLADAFGVSLTEINIKASVEQHFSDISFDSSVHNSVYENSQARERTQVLMDLANKVNGIVIGTGDLSELALGWATYNGDHMSMYGVNASVPKTLIRAIVTDFALKQSDEKLKKVLIDVVDTPVSPELLPPKDGELQQMTEDILGPYELHDFFLYNYIRYGFSGEKAVYLASHAFKDTYSDELIKKTYDIFIRRFFTQQFKRSCLPDGPKTGTVGLSPRGDLRMPSDASSNILD
ncbi:MAG: NAD(+) synthase [Clostridia bacterium]|nr:NAD(+) synthase [Christensenellaceae bacterium]MBR6239664.1 NAD(+) synthase [Clostridia bacterium]